MANSKVIDQAGAMRQGEELDTAAVDAWLKARLPELSGLPEVTQYSGGASNWTYRLQYPEQDLILRRPPAGTKAASAHDMQREFSVQHRIKPVFDKVPEMIAFCDDSDIIGADFYVMQRLEGLIPRRNLPRGVELERAEQRQLAEAVVECLVDLHDIDVPAAGLSDLGKGPGFVDRQVQGWSKRYREAKTWNVPGFEKIMHWLARNAPDDIGMCLIHNDFRMDNMVLDPAQPSRIIGLLDWEMATVGDPLMDLGNTLAYWIQGDDDRFIRGLSRQPSWLPGMLSREQFVDRYLERSGLGPVDMRFYLVFGLFRLAVIVQQIYYRYHHGQTDNPAFKRFWLLAHYINWRSGRLIKTGKI